MNRQILGFAIAMAVVALVAFIAWDYLAPIEGSGDFKESGFWKIVESGDEAAPSPEEVNDRSVDSSQPDSRSVDAFGSVPAIRVVPITDSPADEEWMRSRYMKEESEWSFDEGRVVDIDVKKILDLVKRNPLYEEAKIQGSARKDSVTTAPDMTLTLFDGEQHALSIRRIRLDTIEGYSFVNMTGRLVVPISGAPDSKAAVGDWKLYVNASDGSIRGSITSENTFTRLEHIPDRASNTVVVRSPLDKVRASPPID